MAEFDTDVFIVGTGPTGSTAALALATYGVRVQIITRYRWLSNTPRAHITNQRTMEALRDLGIDGEVARYGSRWDLMGDTLFTTSLAGPEVARIRTWGTGDDRHGDYVKGSPSGMLDVPQPYLESVILKNAAERGANVIFNTEYLSHVQDADGVTVTVRDRLTEREYSVRARYLIGADGAKSLVAEQLGLPIEGKMARATTAYVQFTADLTRFVEHRPSILYWITTPIAGYGEIGMGLLRAVRPWTKWIAGWGYDPDLGEPDFSPDSLRARISALIGEPGIEIELGATSTWQVNQAYATRLSDGRVFCAGDAVHRHPPSGGLGSNTSVQDAYNLAWKLALVIRGDASAALLESFTDERAPVAKQVVDRANLSRVEFGPFNAAIAIAIATGDAGDRVAAIEAKLSDTGPNGVETRAAMAAALELKNYEFNAHGVEMNQRYRSGAVIDDPELGEETWARDPELYLQAAVRPGAKLPHAWLVDASGRRTSTLDLVGHGRFTLVTGLAGQAWAEAVRAIDRPLLDVAVIGGPEARDLYGYWARVRDIDEDGALLVRPDGYIAWRRSSGLQPGERADQIVRSVLAAILGQ